MKTIIILICFYCISCDDIGVDNNNKIENRSFVNSFGTTWYEYGWGVSQIHDGGFIITGRKEYKSNNTKDMITIRTDKNGFGIWERTYGGSLNEEGYSTIQSQDGSILSLGYSWSYGNQQEIFLVKSDLAGRKIWQKTYGGSNRDIGHKLILTADGNIIIIGQTNSPGISRGNDDIWLSKVDQDGKEIWRKAFGQQNHEVAYDIIEIETGGYLIVGYRDFYSDNGKDILIIRTDFEGNMVWEKTLGSSETYDEIAYSISKSSNYGYIICASTNSVNNDWYDPQLINIDFDGNIIWNKIFNGSGLKHTRWTATSTHDGGAAIIGTTNYFGELGGNEDAYLIKVDKNGAKLWDYAIQGGKNDWGWSIIETFLNELVIVGSTKSFGSGLYDILLARIVNSNEK